jgi:hypothetical protein
MPLRPKQGAVRRVLIAIIALVSLGLVGGGLIFVLGGILEQHASDGAYVVAFKHAGEGCDSDATTFDIDDGAAAVL